MFADFESLSENKFINEVYVPSDNVLRALEAGGEAGGQGLQEPAHRVQAGIRVVTNSNLSTGVSNNIDYWNNCCFDR